MWSPLSPAAECAAAPVTCTVGEMSASVVVHADARFLRLPHHHYTLPVQAALHPPAADHRQSRTSVAAGLPAHC